MNYAKAKTLVWISLGYVLLLCIGAGIALTYHQLVHNTQANSDDLQHLHVKSTAVERMLAFSRERSIDLMRLIYTDDPFARDEIKQHFFLLVEQFVQTRTLYLDEISREKSASHYLDIADQETKIMDEYFQALLNSKTVQDDILARVEQGQPSTITGQIFVANALPAQAIALAYLDRLRHLNTQERTQLTAELTSQLEMSERFLYIASVSYFVAWLLISAWSLRLLRRSMQARESLLLQLEDKVIQRTQAYEEVNQTLEKTANYDAVTGLFNRHSFQRYMDDLLKQQHVHFSLLFIDLDNFKWFNDTLGHEAGDKLLQRLADSFQRLLESRSPSFLARLGGDEFVMVCQGHSPTDDALLSKAILDAVHHLSMEGTINKSLGCSIGIARYPEHGRSKSELLRYADFAMYHAKESGKNQYFIFTETMKSEIQQRLLLEEALDKAIRSRQLQVVFQPQYDLTDMQLVGAEALVRWSHQGKQISPDIFIPMAEKSGLIYELGLLVFEKSIQQLLAWEAEGKYLPRVAVNLSQIQLRFPSLMKDLSDLLLQYGLSPERVDLEITESAFMEEQVSSLHVLNELQQWGAQISLDDFGTGYSSLSQIKKLDVDRIKIDRSFIDDIERDFQSQSLVKAIITMAHSLGLFVLAEGIESQGQYALLKSWGCDEGQGYWFSRPVPADQLVFTDFAARLSQA